MFVFLMFRLPPRSTRTDTLFPYTTLFRSPGDRVAVLARNCDQFFFLLIGAALADAVLVPINWRLSGGEVASLLGDSGARILFADEVRLSLAEMAVEASGGEAPTVHLERARHSVAYVKPRSVR